MRKANSSKSAIRTRRDEGKEREKGSEVFSFGQEKRVGSG